MPMFHLGSGSTRTTAVRNVGLGIATGQKNTGRGWSSHDLTHSHAKCYVRTWLERVGGRNGKRWVRVVTGRHLVANELLS